MEKGKWNIWLKMWIGIEAVVGLFVIWLLCTLFSVVLVWAIMGIRFGECTVDLMEQYWSYIKMGYGTMLALCAAQYLRRLYRKYKIDDNGE